MYKVMITYAKRTPVAMTVGDAADYDGSSHPDEVLQFASRQEAIRAGNTYCDACESHPVYGAPGFTVVGG